MNMDELYQKFMRDNGFIDKAKMNQEAMSYTFTPKHVTARALALRKHNRQIAKASRRANRGL